MAVRVERRSPRRKLGVEGILTRLAQGAPNPNTRVRAKDISLVGIYLSSNTILQVNEQVKLQLLLPTSEKSQMQGPVDLFGTVARIESLPEDQFGLGILFYGASRFKFD